MQLLIFCFLLVAAATRSVESVCTPDSYSNLPAAPVFPTSTLPAAQTPTPSAANPLIVGHWSEVAKYGQYRPPAFTPVANPTQSGCPHLQSDVVYWHNSSVWTVPSNGSDVTIPANTKMVVASCSIPASYIFGIVTIPAGSQLIFPDAPVTFQARGFQVSGALLAGSATCRLRNKVTITLWGRRGAQSLPADPKVKGIAVYGTIDMHGAQYFPTWTRLAMSADAGDNIIFVQDIVNWQPGQQILITTTELKDARDFTHNEVRTIVAVSRTTLDSTVAAIEVDAPLTYRHYGGREYQAEVSLLSRNILIQGDPVNSEPTDTSKPICKDSDNSGLESPSESTYPCEDQFLTGFGGHVQVIGENSVGRFSGVELYRMGQTNQMGRYPLHFHLMGQKDPSTAFAQDCSVHRSFFRCFVIHGTHNALLTQNTAYDAIGNCFYLSEDGVEENSTISYNFASHVHPLGNPAITTYIDRDTQYYIDGDGWYGQFLNFYTNNSNLIIPADLSAAGFYITNGHNHIYGNAASGGWTGFSFPSLSLPIGDFRWVNNTNPSGRPFASPFRGNTAHSTGFWWASAGAFYFGGVLEYTDDSKTTLQYTAGRSLDSHDTCSDPTAGTPAGSYACWEDDQTPLWLRLEDNKAFLAHRGLQAWGNRAEVIRMELHDVALSMNVFGEVWIDQLLMECRSNHTPSWFAGCPVAPPVSQSPPWSDCSVRDWYFFNSLRGFQWYDVAQRHILTNSTFRNCRSDWYRCIYGPADGVCDSTVFESLTHSDQFVPELMQVTKSIRFQNSNNLRSFATDPPPITIAGRLQSWFDADGSVSGLGVPTMIGSNRSKHWWDTTQNCPVVDQTYVCALNQNDGAASVVLEWNANQQDEIGSSVCGNGNGLPCPVVGSVTHFGRVEGTGLDLAVNAKITGPIIYEAGGWFIRLSDGTPRVVSFAEIQVDPAKSLVVALPYPSGTTFEITYQGASWCEAPWVTCVHNFRAANSIEAVAQGPGDLYYFADGILYVRLVMQPSTWPVEEPAVWTSVWPTPANFSRNGLTLYQTSQSSVRIRALNCGNNPCAVQPNTQVPDALRPGSATTAVTGTVTTLVTTGTATGTGTGTVTGTVSSSTSGSGGNGGGSSSSGCFAASSLVRVLASDGQTVMSKTLADLAVGDHVESFAGNQRVFSEVYYIAHDGDESLTELVQLSVAKSSPVLKLTANHLVLVADNPSSSSSASLQAAGLVKAGQFLFRLNEEGVLAPAAVVAVSRTKEAVRNPLTLNGHIVVSDLACSTFVYSDSLYRVLVAPLQAVYQAAPSLLQRGSPLTCVVDLIVKLTDFFESVFTMPFAATLSAY